MPRTTPTTDRPQTLRQAKRAYLKSSAKPKLSASELAAIERRAVLQERADRIREREARRKANIKKKEERKEKERESLLRLGKEPPKAGGIKVGPSQLDLATFLPTVDESMNGEKAVKGGHTHITREEKQVEQGKEETRRPTKTTITMAPPPRPPLRQISANVSSKPSTTSIIKHKAVFGLADSFDDVFVSNTQIERELSPPTKQSAFLAVEPTATLNLGSYDYATCDTDGILAQISTQDLDFSDVLTQVQPITAPEPASITFIDAAARDSFQALSRGHGSLISQCDDESQILANISTQDLDLGDLSQPSSPTALETLLKPSTSFDYSDDFTDKELVSLAVEVELQSSSKSSSDTHFFRDSGG